MGISLPRADRIQRTFGKHHRGILLESLTQGILWKAPERDSIGKPHKGILLENLTKGILWKAAQRNSIGTPQERQKYRNALKDFFQQDDSSLSETSRERLANGNVLRILDSKDLGDR